MSEAGDMILGSLREFGEALKSGEPLERRLTVRTYRLPGPPPAFDARAVQAVREVYRMSQGAFAAALGVTTGTLQSWEQGRRLPSPLACRLLDELAASPDHFRARFAKLAGRPEAPGRKPAVKGRPAGAKAAARKVAVKVG